MNDKLQILDKISSPGKEYNEDLLLNIENEVYAVLDGASPITSRPIQEYSSQAQWLVHAISGRLSLQDIRTYGFPYATQICMNTLKKEYPFIDASPYDRPSCTIGAVLIKNHVLESYLLGDCSIYIQHHSGHVEHIYDNRIDVFSQKTLFQKKQGRLNPLENIKRQKQLNDKFRNTEEGFWVIGYTGCFATQYICRQWDISNIARVLICSDGYSRLFREFELISPIEILSQGMSLQQGREILRQYEVQYGDIHSFPCVKTHDDASAILLEVV